MDTNSDGRFLGTMGRISLATLSSRRCPISPSRRTGPASSRQRTRSTRWPTRSTTSAWTTPATCGAYTEQRAAGVWQLTALREQGHLDLHRDAHCYGTCQLRGLHSHTLPCGARVCLSTSRGLACRSDWHPHPALRSTDVLKQAPTHPRAHPRTHQRTHAPTHPRTPTRTLLASLPE